MTTKTQRPARGEKPTTSDKESKPTPQPAGSEVARPAVDWVAALEWTVKQANSGDQKSLRGLRAFLDLNPDLWAKAGDVTRAAEAAWIEQLAGTDALVAESVRRVVAEMKADLKGPHPTRMESLLADQVALTYLAVQHGEAKAAAPPSGSIPEAAFRLKRAESAQRRHLAAVRTLATLRVLMPAGMIPLKPLRVYTPAKATA